MMPAWIANCRIRFTCSKDWYDLEPDPDSKDRSFCTECQRHVYLCRTEADFEKRRSAGECVALMEPDGSDVPVMGIPCRPDESGDRLPPTLERIETLLAGAGLAPEREGDALVVQRGDYTTRIELAPHEEGDSPLGPIEAVVQVRTALPADLSATLAGDLRLASLMNTMASVGALTFEGSDAYIGSRLTIFASEREAWRLHGALVLLAVLEGAGSMIRGVNAALAGTPPAPAPGTDGPSAWTEDDFEEVGDTVSGWCVCSTGRGFTAEFGLRPGATSALAGDTHSTALWTMNSAEPHPGLGGGLLCMLQMPHRIPDRARLGQVLAQLNQLETQPLVLPPHFGAWCEGRIGGNPAYVTFLPNALHDTAHGIATSMTVWAMARAQWANATLASMGVPVTLTRGER